MFGFLVDPLKGFTRGLLHFFNCHEFYLSDLFEAVGFKIVIDPVESTGELFFKVVIYATVLKTNKTKHSQQILNCN